MDLSKPKVMGIINVTPDSFYKRSRKQTMNEALKEAEKMLREGADFLDIGGYSSRPGSQNVSIDEELARVIPPILSIKTEFPGSILSIDTFRSRVAEQAVDVGADIINDISSGHLDSKMLPVVSRLKVPYIAMHMKGTPQNMQKQADYENPIREILFYFSEVIEKSKALGIKDLMLDPGFGFSKTVEHNFHLLNKLEHFRWLEFPLLAGLSRKSMIHKTLDQKAENALNGTIILNTLALFKGISILRVHDIKEATALVKLMSKLS